MASGTGQELIQNSGYRLRLPVTVALLPTAFLFTPTLDFFLHAVNFFLSAVNFFLSTFNASTLTDFAWIPVGEENRGKECSAEPGPAQTELYLFPNAES